MKKLAYIILIIAILVVISHFVKQSNTTPSAVEDVVIVVDENNSTDAQTDSENTVPAENAIQADAPAMVSPEAAAMAEDNDIVDVQEDIIIEDQAPEEEDVVEVEESNPSETAGEDETIIKE